MGLIRRGNVWYVRLRHRGKEIRLSTKTGNKRAAEKALARIRLELAEGKDPSGRDRRGATFAEFAKEYERYGNANLRSWEKEKGRFNRIVKEFGPKFLKEIGLKDLEDFKIEILKDHKPAGVNRYIMRVKAMMRLARSWGYLDSNPAVELKALPERNQRVRFLSKAEFERLLAVARPALRPLLTAAVYTGMRAGELLSLTWGDLDRENGIVRVRAGKNNEPRQIPLHPRLREALKGIRVRRLRDPRVFVWENGEPIIKYEVSFNAALEAAGIVDFRFHDLRHTFASWMVMSGADLRTVQELLGHKSLAMVMRYAHLARGHVREALFRLPSGGKEGKPDGKREGAEGA